MLWKTGALIKILGLLAFQKVNSLKNFQEAIMVCQWLVTTVSKKKKRKEEKIRNTGRLKYHFILHENNFLFPQKHLQWFYTDFSTTARTIRVLYQAISKCYWLYQPMSKCYQTKIFVLCLLCYHHYPGKPVKMGYGQES